MQGVFTWVARDNFGGGNTMFSGCLLFLAMMLTPTPNCDIPVQVLTNHVQLGPQLGLTLAYTTADGVYIEPEVYSRLWLLPNIIEHEAVHWNRWIRGAVNWENTYMEELIATRGACEVAPVVSCQTSIALLTAAARAEAE